MQAPGNVFMNELLGELFGMRFEEAAQGRLDQGIDRRRSAAKETGDEQAYCPDQ